MLAGLACLIALACFISITGCNRDGVAEIDDATDAASGKQADGAAKTSGAFGWPVDPSHPVLEVTIESSAGNGTILIEMMPELAPATVLNILELADAGFYDGTTFHRVIPGFMIQGGDPKSRDRDPTNDGTGGADVKIQDEFSDAPYLRGVVGMGNRGRANSTSSQFFIMQADNVGLDGRYNAVGRVLLGMELVDAISRVDVDRSGRWGPKDRPLQNVVMTSVRTIGQIATVTKVIELETKAKAKAAIGFAPNTAENSASATVVSNQQNVPAAPNPGEDWQRLEAEGR